MPDQLAHREDSAVVVNLLKGAVPERGDEIADLWERYDPAVEVAPSRLGVTMEAEKQKIRFDIKTVEIFWLVSFSVWRSIETYSPVVLLGPIAQVTIDEFLASDGELPEFERDYKDRLAMAKSIITGKDPDFSKWPSDVPRPHADRERLANAQDKMAFDLAALALATAFLHELRHVIFLNEPEKKPAALVEEEIASDVWARSFLTDKLADYAKAHGHGYQIVLTKRAMAMALSAIVIHAITPLQVHWGNAQYPPMADRIAALMGNVRLGDESRFWDYTACLLIGVFRQAHRRLDFVPRSPRHIVEELLARLH